MNFRKISLATAILLAGCTNAPVTRSSAIEEASVLFETVCMASLGNPSQATQTLENSGLERISNTSEGGTRFFSEPNWIYAVTGTRTSDFGTRGRVEYDYCYIASKNLTSTDVEEIQKRMAAKHIDGSSTYQTTRSSSRTTLRADKPIAGRNVYIVSGQPPKQPAGQQYSSIELQQIR